MIEEIRLYFRASRGLSIAVVCVLTAIPLLVFVVALLFLQGFHVINAPTLIKSLIGVFGALIVLGPIIGMTVKSKPAVRRCPRDPC